MPRKRITFIVIPSNDGPVQEYKLSSRLLWIGGLLGAVALSSLSYYAFQYHRRADQARQIEYLQDENRQLLSGLEGARRDVGKLEMAMGVLAQQDQRLRDYHEMEPVRDPILGLGVGGPQEPEDLPEDYTGLPSRKRALLEDLSLRVDRLQREARYQQASFELLIEKFSENSVALRYVPAIAPVPKDRTWKSSSFDRRIDPFTGQVAFHSGLDFAGRVGIKVRATADGEVIYAYTDVRLGNVVVINHNPTVVDENGTETSRPGMYRTEYGHLSELRVQKGQRVQRGDVVGLMGSTGRSTGPHLHYAVRYQDKRRGGRRGYLDPEDFLLDWPKEDRVAVSRHDDRAVAPIATQLDDVVIPGDVPDAE